MAKPTRTPNKAELFLSERIKSTREACGLTHYALGREINAKTQQIDSYERGGFVPLPIIEKLGHAFGNPVGKKIIRRISFLRKLEIEKGEEQPDLIDWYDEAFPLNPELDD